MGIYGSGLAHLPANPNTVGSWSALCNWIKDPNGDGDEADSQADSVVLIANHPGAPGFLVEVDFREQDAYGNWSIPLVSQRFFEQIQLVRYFGEVVLGGGSCKHLK
jgi:hypothetical protein